MFLYLNFIKLTEKTYLSHPLFLKEKGYNRRRNRIRDLVKWWCWFQSYFRILFPPQSVNLVFLFFTYNMLRRMNSLSFVFLLFHLQAGVYANAVHMLELDLLIKRRWAIVFIYWEITKKSINIVIFFAYLNTLFGIWTIYHKPFISFKKIYSLFLTITYHKFARHKDYWKEAYCGTCWDGETD